MSPHQLFIFMLCIAAMLPACSRHGGDCDACFADPSGSCGFCGFAGYGGFCGEGNADGSLFINQDRPECPNEIWYFPGRPNLDQCLSSRVTLGNGTFAVGAIPFLLPGFGGFVETTISANVSVAPQKTGENATISSAARVVVRSMFYDQGFIGVFQKNYIALQRLVLYGAATVTLSPSAPYVGIDSGVGVVMYDSLTFLALAEVKWDGNSLGCLSNETLESCPALVASPQIRTLADYLKGINISSSTNSKTGDTTITISGDVFSISHKPTDRNHGQEVNPFEADCEIAINWTPKSSESNALTLAVSAVHSKLTIKTVLPSDTDPSIQELSQVGVTVENDTEIYSSFFKYPNYVKLDSGKYFSAVANQTVRLLVLPLKNSRKRDTNYVPVTYSADTFAVLAAPSDGKLSPGAIAGITIGGVVLLGSLIAGLLIWKFYDKVPSIFKVSRSHREESWR